MQIETEELEQLQTEETLVEESPTEELQTEELPAEEIPTEQPETEEAPTEEIPTEQPETEESLPEEQPDPALPLWKKINYRSPKLWTAVIGGLACLIAVIVILVALGKPRQQPEPTTPTKAPTTPTTEPTEPTLPPPKANPIALGDFAMMGGYLTCLSTESVLGIDVSVWQGDINWQKVKEAGIEYAMIRVAARDVESGELFDDKYAQANYAGATEAGIKVGAYIFSQAITVAEAVEEADYLMERIKDWHLEMPLVFDWEPYSDTARTADVDARTLTDCSKAFCDRVKAAGYEPMIYFNISHSLERIYIRELTDYKFWLAYYDTTLLYPYKIDMWQYTDTGTVPGISANVDINLYFPWKEE